MKPQVKFILLICLTSAWLLTAHIQQYNVKEITVINNVDSVFYDTISPVYEVTGTKYNAVPAQTDNTPFNTGDGSFIDTAALRRGELKWVALSWDLLWFRGGPFNYGDSIYVYHTNEVFRGWWEVHDAMNPRHRNRIDFLQPVGVNNISGHNPNILISKEKFFNDR